jgi:hypothetical protein
VRLSLFPAEPALTADLDARVLSGVALPYGAEGRTSAGTVIVDAGAVTIPADLKRIKLFRDHGRTAPVGYATAADDGPAALSMSFRAAATPDGDTALLEAAEGVRDALSVELDDVQISAGHVTAATLEAVALVAIPAFADARLKAADTPPRKENPMTAPDPTPEPPAPVDSPPSPVPAPEPPEQRLNASLSASARVPSFTAAVARIRDALNGATDAGAINAALTDVVPANDGGKGFLRDQWLGEIWQPLAAQRHYIPAIQSATLTGMRVYGWKWTTTPQVGIYAGNKTPIPSNAVKIDPAEATAYRLAGGWDVDRIYSDLASPGFLEALFQAATVDCAAKTEAHVAATLMAGATDLGTAATLTEALTLIGAQLAPFGLTPSFIALASDVFAAYSELTTAQVPWWLASTSNVSLATGTGSVGGQTIFCDPNLAAGTVLAGARQAATYYQAPGSPLRITAVNVPNGGIDIAVFLYAAEMINDARGIVTVEVVGP